MAGSCVVQSSRIVFLICPVPVYEVLFLYAEG